MKFLNLNRVLCYLQFDDFEYGMLGSMIKCRKTNFDVVLSKVVIMMKPLVN